MLQQDERQDFREMGWVKAEAAAESQSNHLAKKGQDRSCLSELCHEALQFTSLSSLDLFEHFKVQENRKREILAN